MMRAALNNRAIAAACTGMHLIRILLVMVSAQQLGQHDRGLSSALHGPTSAPSPSPTRRRWPGPCLARSKAAPMTRTARLAGEHGMGGHAGLDEGATPTCPAHCPAAQALRQRCPRRAGCRVPALLQVLPVAGGVRRMSSQVWWLPRLACTASLWQCRWQRTADRSKPNGRRPGCPPRLPAPAACPGCLHSG